MEALLRLYTILINIRNAVLGVPAGMLHRIGIRPFLVHAAAILLASVLFGTAEVSHSVFIIVGAFIVQSLAAVASEQKGTSYTKNNMLFAHTADVVLVGVFLSAASTFTLLPLAIAVSFLVPYVLVGFLRIGLVLQYTSANHIPLPSFGSIAVGFVPLRWTLLIGFVISVSVSVSLLFPFTYVAAVLLVLYGLIEVILVKGKVAYGGLHTRPVP